LREKISGDVVPKTGADVKPQPARAIPPKDFLDIFNMFHPLVRVNNPTARNSTEL
jgi:hypothetical protein